MFYAFYMINVSNSQYEPDYRLSFVSSEDFDELNVPMEAIDIYIIFSMTSPIAYKFVNKLVPKE